MAEQPLPDKGAKDEMEWNEMEFLLPKNRLYREPGTETDWMTVLTELVVS